LKRLCFAGVRLFTLSARPSNPRRVSTIYGNWRRGTGVLNNELYIGKLVWNRQTFIKDPETGKQQARLNPPGEWIVQGVRDLHIIDDRLWEQVKTRQLHTRHLLTHDDAGVRSERARRPVYLLSNLLRCGNCGGGFSKISQHHYGCSNARNRGTCGNLLTIRRDVLEASVLSGLRTHLMAPELVKEFVAEYHRELNRLNGARESDGLRTREELDRVERHLRALIEAIKEGLRTPSMKDELLALEAQKARLQSEIERPRRRCHGSIPHWPRFTGTRSSGCKTSSTGQSSARRPQKRFAVSSMKCGSSPRTSGWRSSSPATWPASWR
jgi:site-specific DNA recombinase